MALDGSHDLSSRGPEAGEHRDHFANDRAEQARSVHDWQRLMFVHGYNKDRGGDIMERHNLLQAGPGNAGYKGATISFNDRVERLSQALPLTAGCAARAASRAAPACLGR